MKAPALPLSLDDVLRVSGGECVNRGDLAAGSEIRLQRMTTLATSRPGDLAFFFSKEYQNEVVSARPSVLVTAPPFVAPLKASGLPIWKSTAIVACANPYLAMAELSRLFAQSDAIPDPLPDASSVHYPEAKIHPTAVVSPDAKIGRGVEIGPYVVIDSECEIGDGSTISAHCTLGHGVKIGKRTKLFPSVHVYPQVEIGNEVRIHSTTVIGSDGFGYAPKEDGGTLVDHVKIYHLGRVIVEDRVEMGAGCTIDRATFGETRIGKNTKLDNQVHVGHNGRLGEGVIICGGTCLAGGVDIGRYVYIGGLTGITNRLKIGDGAQLGAMSLVTKDVEPGGNAVGNPARPSREHFKIHAMLNRMLDKKKGKTGAGE